MVKSLWDRLNGAYKKHEILRNFTAVFSIDILVKASGFLLLPVYLKLMTQEEFGLYSYLINIISTFSLVLNFGLYVAQSKLYHDYSQQERRNLIFTLNGLLFIFVFCILICMYFIDADYYLVRIINKGSINYSKYRVVVFLGLFTYIYSLMIYNLLMTCMLIRKIQIFNLSKLLLVNGIVLLVLVFGGDDKVYERLFYSIIVEMCIVIAFYFSNVKQMSFIFDFKMAKKGLKIGIPVMGGAIVGIITALSDKFFLERADGLKDLSSYYLALTFAGILATIFSTIQNIYLPDFFKEKDWQRNLHKTKKVVKTIFFLFLLLSICIYLTVYLTVTLGLIDIKYKLTLNILPILLVSQLVACLTILISNYIMYLEKMHVGFIFTVFLSFVCLFSNYLLISRYHSYGAAVSNLIISLLSFSLYYVYLKMIISVRR